MDEEPYRESLVIDFGLITPGDNQDQEGNQANFNPQSVDPLTKSTKISLAVLLYRLN